MGPELLGASALVAFVLWCVLATVLGARLALLVAVLRAGLPLFYFGGLDDGTWRLYDDVSYAQDAAELLASGASPFALVFDADASLLLFSLAGGQNVAYYVWNALAHQLFGEHYWSAVLLNVLASGAGALAFWRILRLAEVGAARARAAVLFFLLHWDVLAWSSFVNLKDTLVLALSLWLCAAAVSLARSRRVRVLDLALLAGSCFTLYFLRWYVPTLFALAFGLWGSLELGGKRRLLLLASGVAFLAWQAGRPVPEGYLEPAGILTGAGRFLFTPRPWGIEERYGFLVVPAVLHWVTLPFALVGAWHLARSSSIARFLLLYLVIVIGFYAAVPQLQGPRHRYQAVFVLAWFQFEGLWRALLAVLARPAPARSSLPEPSPS